MINNQVIETNETCSEPKASIVIPVYNAENYIGRCLKSLVGQTFKDFEVICVNDCTPDESIAIIRKFSDSLRIKIIDNLENMGAGPSRQKGIDASTGEYIFFIDSDDYVKNDFLEMYLGASKKANFDIIVGGFIRDTTKNQLEYYPSHSSWSVLSGSACTKAYKRDFLADNGIQFASTKYGEDAYMNLCCFYADPIYEVIDYAGYFYFENEKSSTMIHKEESTADEDIIKIFQRFLSLHDMASISQQKSHQIEYMFLAHIFNALLVYCKGCGSESIDAKYNLFVRSMNKLFPNAPNNPYVGFFRPKGQSFKTRFGVGACMMAYKMHMLKSLLHLMCK